MWKHGENLRMRSGSDIKRAAIVGSGDRVWSFVWVTGHNRKHGLRVLNHPPTVPIGCQRSEFTRRRCIRRSRMWEAADRICGRRLPSEM